MATTEQMRLRRDRIIALVEALSSGETTVGAVPYNLKVPVLASALAQGVITPNDVPPKIARDVSLNFLKEAPWRERDAAADKGTEVHSLAESLSQGEIVDVPPALRRHVRSWMQWRDDYEMTFVETEFTVYSPTHYYAGTGDVLGYSGAHPEWGLICGDYKTSRSGIWPDIALQLAAIRYADFIGRPDLSEDRVTLPKIKTFVGIQITEDGYKVVPVRVNEATFRVFLSASNVARWKTDFEQFALEESRFVNLREEAS